MEGAQITTTTIANKGNRPVMVLISYQGYEEKVLLSPGEVMFFPVKIPEEAILFPYGEPIAIVYNPSDFQPLPLMHSTSTGNLLKRGRFLVPGFRGDGNNQSGSP